MSTKIVFRKGSSVPNDELMTVGEPLWDPLSARFGVNQGELQPRWYPKLDANNNIILNTGTKIYNPLFDPINGLNLSYITYSNNTLQFWSNNTLVASFDDTNNVLYSALQVNSTVTATGAVSFPGFTILADGTVQITGNLQVLGNINLSLATFAAAVLPTLYNNGDILTAGVPHTWKNPTSLAVNSQLATLIGKTSGVFQTLKMDWLNTSYFATQPLGVGQTIPSSTITNDFIDFIAAIGATYTRNSTATYYDKFGAIQSIAANKPRLDHDPYTGERLGFLIEPNKTNLISNSTDFSSWTQTGLAQSAITNNIWTLRNLGNPTLLSEDTTTGVHNQSALFVNGSENTPVTFSGYFQVDPATVRQYIAITIEDSTTSNYFGSYFDLGGTPSASSGITFGSGNLSRVLLRQITSKIYRISISGTINANTGASVASLRVRIGAAATNNGSLSYTGLGGPVCWLNDLQLEINDKVTSYIPTSGTSASRAADFLSIPLTAFDFQQNVGTFTVSVRAKNYISPNAPIALVQGNLTATNHSLAINSGSAPEVILSNGGSALYDVSLSSLSANTVNRFSWSYLLGGNAIAAKDGSLSSSAELSIVPTGLTTLLIGCNSAQTQYLDTWLSSFSYTNRKLSTSQL